MTSKCFVFRHPELGAEEHSWLQNLFATKPLNKLFTCRSANPVFYTEVRKRSRWPNRNWLIIVPHGGATSRSHGVRQVRADGRTSELFGRLLQKFANLHSRPEYFGSVEPDLRAWRMTLRCSFQCLKSSLRPRLNNFKCGHIIDLTWLESKCHITCDCRMTIAQIVVDNVDRRWRKHLSAGMYAQDRASSWPLCHRTHFDIRRTTGQLERTCRFVTELWAIRIQISITCW